MPAMADLSLSDGSTARTFSVLNPSGGDKTAALWRWEDTAKNPLCRAVAQCTSRYNGDRTARHVDLKMEVPYYVTDAFGVQVVRGKYLFAGTAVIPLLLPAANLTEGMNFSSNLMSAALIKSVLTSGFAPT